MRKLINEINNNYISQPITIDTKCKVNKILFETPAIATTDFFFFFLKSWRKLTGKNLKLLEFLLEQ